MSAWRGIDLTGVDDAFKERFWSKVDQRGPDECWPWTAYCKPSGYGQFVLRKGRFVTASRIALGLTIGRPIEANEVACHKCDNPPCCNPSHLLIGTQSDNAYDCVSKGRANRARGEATFSSKLTEADVIAIRAEGFVWGNDQRWAKRLGVSSNTIRSARLGRHWKHLNEQVSP